MNIFWLAVCFAASAAAHCDQHVVKMPLEAAQILYTARFLLDPTCKWRKRAPLNKTGTQRGYRPTHLKHPAVLWAAKSRENYTMVCRYGLALCKEYTLRYGKELHAEQHLRWLAEHVPKNFRKRGMTSIPLCTGEGGKAKTLEEAVERYRAFYIRDKTRFARYRHSEPPQWLIN